MKPASTIRLRERKRIENMLRRGAVRLEPPVARDVLERVARLLAERAGLGKLFEAVVESLPVLLHDRILFIDEFHLLDRDPIAELEALCKMLTFYPEYRGWKLVATASEGWVLSARLEPRLLATARGWRSLRGLTRSIWPRCRGSTRSTTVAA